MNGEKTLTDLSTKFKLVNAVMLYHLDILKKQRLLGQRHEGRKVYYWLNYSRLKQAIHTINSTFGGELIETVSSEELIKTVQAAALTCIWRFDRNA